MYSVVLECLPQRGCGIISNQTSTTSHENKASEARNGSDPDNSPIVDRAYLGHRSLVTVSWPAAVSIKLANTKESVQNFCVITLAQ